MNIRPTLKSDTPKLSIIIVTWNAWHDLQKALKSIFNSDYSNMEVVVIDNASIDQTAVKLEASFPQVKLHLNKCNEGHTRGVNKGFDLVTGQYVMVLDADVEIEPDTIKGMIHFMDSHPEISLATPRTLNTDGSIQESARKLPSVMSGIFGRQSLLTKFFPNNPISKNYLSREFLNASKPFPVEQISGACMLFPRTLLSEVGKWDERYPGYWVDTDWCAQIIHQNLKIYCVPQFILTHHENNASGKKKSPRRIWLFHYGAYQLYKKWHCFGRLDPRAIFAALLLSIRAIGLIAINSLPRSHKNASVIHHQETENASIILENQKNE